MPNKHARKAHLDPHNPMSAEAFRDWRKRLNLKQKDAAEVLGLTKRMIQYYETGSRSGQHVAIPKSVRLACYALEMGVGDYDGHSVIASTPVAPGLLRDPSADLPYTPADSTADEQPGEALAVNADTLNGQQV